MNEKLKGKERITYQLPGDRSQHSKCSTGIQKSSVYPYHSYEYIFTNLTEIHTTVAADIAFSALLWSQQSLHDLIVEP